MKKKIKVIHVHFFCGHKNFYFGSITSLFRSFTAQDIGCSEAYLRHYLTQEGIHYINKKVLIIRTTLR